MRVKIGQIIWEFIEDPSMEDDTFGMTDYMGAVVRLNPRQTREQIRETVCHELLHVLVFSGGVPLEGLESEETIISILSPLLLDVLCRNPVLRGVLVGDLPIHYRKL